MSGHADTTGRARRFKYGRYGFVSDRGLNPRRVTNEDSFLLLESIPLFAVADGVGGQNAGEVASQVTVEILKHYFSQRKLPGNKVKFVEQVIRHAHRYLREMALDDELLSGMATTLALILLEKKRAILSHIGDSRIYSFVGDELRRETIDHTIADDRLYQVGDYASVDKNVITRALGVGAEVEPETKIVPLLPNTTFLLCTDGIYRHISDEELADILRQERDPQTVCHLLKERCYQRGAKDNLTAIVVSLGTTSWFVGARARRRAGDSISSGSEASTRVARIQVRLSPPTEKSEPAGRQRQAETPPSSLAGRVAPLINRGGKGVGTSSSWGRRALVTLLITLTLAIGFLTGLYLQRLSPSLLTRLVAPVSSPGGQLFQQGRRAFEAGHTLEALESFSQAVKVSPETARYHRWLGRAQMRLKEYHRAAESFHRAASLGGRAEDYLYAAAAYQALGDGARADEELKAYLENER